MGASAVAVRSRLRVALEGWERMKTDATKCAVCGGEFSAKRVIIDGRAMHQGCSVMSYPSHTPKAMNEMNNEIQRLIGLLRDKQYIRLLADYNRGHLSHYRWLKERDDGIREPAK